MSNHLFCSLLALVILACGFLKTCMAQEATQADTVTTSGQGEMLLMADSLTARYAGLDRVSAPRVTGSRVTGHLSYTRTLIPLSHTGSNIFQPLLDDPRIRNTIRLLKDDTEWDPFIPGQSATTPRIYHYDQDGATRNSHMVRGTVARRLDADVRVGYSVDARYGETWGPFPNQRTTRMESLFRVSYRMSQAHQTTVNLLGMDNGWHIRRGNTVYADRARYILEDLNQWRSRTGGAEIVVSGLVSPALSYRAYMRVLSSQWASDPPDPARITSPVTPAPSAFLDGLFPATMTSVFSAHRSYRTFSLGTQVTLQANTTHQVTFGVETALHRLAQRQFWRTSGSTDQYNLNIRPHEYAFSIRDRFRFGSIVMGLGLRYDVYDPGNALWRDVYLTLGDDRASEDAIRQLLLSTGGKAETTHLLSPHISLSYPSGAWSAHMTFSVSPRYPSFEDLYADTDRSTTPYADRTITALRPRRLTTLEGGVGINRGTYTIDVTAFYRDSERYVPLFGPEVLPQTLSNYAGYWGQVNRGFRRQSGIETSIIRRLAPLGVSKTEASARFSYLYLKDLGPVRNSDRALQPGNPLTPGDFTTFDRRLNEFWDRRHWFSAIASLRFPSGIVVSTVGYLKSGVPYRSPTATAVGQTVRPEQVLPVHFGPWGRRLDTRIDMPLPLGESFPSTILFFEVRNLMDESIVENIADPRSFEATGEPDNLLDQRQWVYGPARAIWTGLGFRW